MFHFRTLARAGAMAAALMLCVGETQACWFGHGGTTAYRPTYAYYAPPAPTYAYYAPAPTMAYYAPTYTAAYNPCSACSACSTCNYAPVTSYYQPITTMRPTYTYYAPSYGCSTCATNYGCSTCGGNYGGCDSCGGSSYVSSGSSGCSTCAGTTTISTPTYNPQPSPTPAVNPGPATTFQQSNRPATETSPGPSLQNPQPSPSDANPMPGGNKTSAPGLFAPRTQDRTASMPALRGLTDSGNMPGRTVSDLRPAAPRAFVPEVNLND